MKRAKEFVRLLMKAISTKAGDDEMTHRVDEKLRELEQETARTRKVVEQNAKRIERVEALVLAGESNA